MSKSGPGRKLRQAAASGTLPIPGAFNAYVGRLIERAGFPAVYLSGAAMSAGVLAMPDIGLISLTELVQQATYLTRSVEIPVIVDADTGFGEAINVQRTVVELQRAGVAAIQLEDQRLPKRCGHLSGKTLVEPEEMCAKIRAAAAARSDPDLVLLARTDARGVTDFDDAVHRARLYVEAGADWIFPEALTTAEEFGRFGELVEVPLVANMTEFGKSPLLGLSELSGLGYAGVLFPVTLFRFAMKAVTDALERLAAEGTQSGLIGEMQTRGELYEVLGYADYLAQDRAYFNGEKPS